MMKQSFITYKKELKKALDERRYGRPAALPPEPFTMIECDSDINDLAELLIDVTNTPHLLSQDLFWIACEKTFLAAVIAFLYSCGEKESQTLSNLGKLIGLESDVIDMDETGVSGVTTLDILFEQLERKEPDGYAVKMYRTYKLVNPEARTEVVKALAYRMHVFAE